MPKLSLLVLLGCLALAGCGQKGPLVPPPAAASPTLAAR
jgi:predicted small lipoprotein YifL